MPTKKWLLCMAPLIKLAMAAGCGGNGAPSNGNDEANDNTRRQATISGRLSVVAEADRTTILEEEPNDSLAQAQPLGSVQAGQRLEIFGDLSAGDASDVFTLTTAESLAVAVVLSFDFTPDDSNDFALGVLDSRPAACTLVAGGQAYAECFDTDQNPETAAFTADGEFHIAAAARSGSGHYVMGLTFEAAGTPAAAGRRDEAIVAGQIVAKFDPGVAPQRRRHIASGCGLAILQETPSGYVLLGLPATTVPAAAGHRAAATRAAVRALRQTPGVTRAEPNYRYYPAASPDDEFASLQWHYDLINLPDAWDVTTGSPDVVVAVVDTGILNHPDITGRVVGGFDFIGDPNSARDGDGIDPDPTDPGDLSGGPGQSSFHGTHVSGTVAASTNTAIGVAGVTWSCGLLAVRALGAGGGTSFDIAEAIRYSAGAANISGTLPDKPARVINLSIASPTGTPASTDIGDAITDAVARGVVVVAAAGNEASSLPAFPAAFDNVISVSACDPQMNLAPYSNFGPTIDLGAPGGNLAFDLTGDGFGDGVLSLGGSETAGGVDYILTFQHGTSMAAPHVSGVAALVRSVNPALTAGEVREVLAATARNVGTAGQFGAGVIDAALAVNEASLRNGVPDLDQPKLSLSTHAVDFGGTLDRLIVRITNTGGGELQVDEPQVVELGPSGWLSAGLEHAPGGGSVAAVVLTVQRSGLPDGRYFAEVRVPAQGLEPQTVDVSMTAGSADAVEDILFVVAINARTRVSIRQDVTAAVRNFDYTIGPLPAGTYKIYAGTDRDDDGLICDIGELCGGHPSAIEAAEVTLEEGQRLGPIDFAVGALVFQTQSQTMTNIPVLRRLDWTPR